MGSPEIVRSSEPGAIDGVPVFDHLLEVRALRSFFFTPRGVLKAVNDVSFHLDEGEILALVGESGCGKTITALSLLRLVPPPGRIVGGEVRLRGRDILALPEEKLRPLRGAELSLVFQEPATALNPLFTVGFQIAETAMVHLGMRKREALDLAVAMLEEVRISDPARCAKRYPHELSGGMKQRVMIALALVAKPSILIADEPTTALDVTIQAQILELLMKLREARGLSVILITHDLGVVAQTADRVAVMYAGRIVEEASLHDLFTAPRHPYTAGLLRSLPGLRAAAGDKRLKAIEGAVPDLLALPEGCAYAPRCPDRFDRCASFHPPLLPTLGLPSRGPAAERMKAAPTGEAAPTGFRRVACFQYDAPAETPRSPDGAGWDAERGR